MTEHEIAQLIPGADSFIAWFGSWPEFHDAEVISCELNRTKQTAVVIHTFDMTKEIDARGYFVLDKHALVTFHFKTLVDQQLSHFNDQNVLFGLTLDRTEGNVRVTFDPAHGLEGFITAKELYLEWTPRKPTEGIYAT